MSDRLTDIDKLDFADAIIARLTAELEAARELLAKATEFKVGDYDVRYATEDGRWHVWTLWGGLKSLEKQNDWPTAVEAVAAAEKAREP